LAASLATLAIIEIVESVTYRFHYPPEIPIPTRSTKFRQFNNLQASLLEHPSRKLFCTVSCTVAGTLILMPQNEKPESPKDNYDPETKTWLSDEQLSASNEETQLRVMKHWFHQHFEDPAEECPHESAEGGYQYIWGR
jgi:hypothetical protein